MKQKGLRKLVSMILAVVMVLSMSITGFAEGDEESGGDTQTTTTTYTITIDNEAENYEYTAYQIFAGDLFIDEDEESILSNIVWGNDIDSTDTDLQAALTTQYGTTDAAEIAEKITTGEEADTFAGIIADYVSGGTVSEYDDESSNYTISGLNAGYYLIVNTNVPENDSAYTDYIVKVVGNVEAEPKNNSVPEFDKTVGNETSSNDSENDDATEDYAIGDSVPFTLTATLPASYTSYSTYKLVFKDTLSSGLTYESDSLTVKVDENKLEESNYTVSISEDGQSIEVTIGNLKTIVPSATENSVVVVSYRAVLNDNADSIETNEASLTYSNDPNNDSEGTTTEEKTYVVTFTVVVNKTDGTNSLTGAAFTLYKKVNTNEFEDRKTYYTINDNGEVTEATTYADNTTYYVQVKKYEAGNATNFSFNGLAIGDYVLVESETPNGYNTADPISFTIDAEVIEDANETSGISTKITEINDFKINDLTLTTTVVNNKGSELPSTGGMGATIFYIVGGVLVLGAAVLFVTKKRLGSEN